MNEPEKPDSPHVASEPDTGVAAGWSLGAKIVLSAVALALGPVDNQRMGAPNAASPKAE